MSMWKKLRTGSLLLVALTIAAVAAIACSDDGDDDGAATVAPSATSAAAANPTATTAAGESVAISIGEGDIGEYLTGPDGGTLYIFLRDAPDTSNCVDACLQTWPPLLLEDGESVDAADGIDGDFDTIDTPSGTQVTYNGAPLYYFAADQQAGETRGHLVGGVWFVARPDTASTSAVVVSGSGADAYLAGPTGLTLYTFANDTEGVSNCSGQCLANWPALTLPEGVEPTADAGAGGALATLTRTDDGTRQVTYNGMPLYYFAGDALPGETNGDGVGGVWSLARP